VAPIIRVNSSLLSGNDHAGAPDNCATSGGTITSEGNNLSDDDTCAPFTEPGDKANTAAGINATLANNGGPTMTHALNEGSEAINAGKAAGCPTTDQRGYSRQGACDIGAFEFGGTAPAPSAVRASKTRPTAVRGARGAGVPDSRPTPRGGTVDVSIMR
jgi:hypothetical protein